MPTVLAVCVVSELTHVGGRVGISAINKKPVDGPVKVRELGLYGDVQADRAHHGGLEKAVYAYSQESIGYWEEELGRSLPPGHFGENLRTRGIDLEAALFGERWKIGSAEFEVSRGRYPCASFETWMGEPRWLKRFHEAGLPGTYLRVVRTGEVRAGDSIEVTYRPSHGVTMGQWYLDPSKEAAQALMAAHVAQEFDLRDRQRAEVLRVLGLREEEDRD